MRREDDLIASAQQAAGADAPVKAAGVFALADNYAAITAGGVATAMLTPGKTSPLLGGALGAASIEASRETNARGQGLTERMLVAVTDSSLHVFSLPPVGSKPGQELMRFEKPSTEVEMKKFGLSRRLNLTDTGSGHSLHLTGSTTRLASASEGDRAVLAELDGWQRA